LLITFACLKAGVVELVDTLDLGSSASRRGGRFLLIGDFCKGNFSSWIAS